MKKLLLLNLTFLAFFLWPENALASVNCNLTTNPPAPLIRPDSVTFIFDKTIVQNEVNKYPSGGKLFFNFPQAELQCNQIFNNLSVSSTNPSVTISGTNFPVGCASAVLGEGTRGVELIYSNGGTNIKICDTTNYTIGNFNVNQGGSCQIVADYNHDGIPPEGDVDDASWTMSIKNLNAPIITLPLPDPVKFGTPLTMPIIVDYDGNSGGLIPFLDSSIKNTIGIPSYSEKIPISIRTAGEHTVNIYATDFDQANIDKYKLALTPFTTWFIAILNNPVVGTTSPFRKDVLMCSTTFEIARIGATPKPTKVPSPTPTIPALCKQAPCSTGSCSGDCFTCPKCPGYNMVKIVPELRPICDSIDTKFKDKCKQCHSDGKHIWTAIGCVPIDIWIIIKDYLFTTGMGIAGAISFLYFLYGCFLVLTSTGNPEKIEEAKQIIVSAMSGLILIIFSVFILRVISVDILKLPGFG